MIVTTRHPSVSVNVYSSKAGTNSKMVCLGARSVEQGEMAMRRVARKVKLTLCTARGMNVSRKCNFIMNGSINDRPTTTVCRTT